MINDFLSQLNTGVIPNLVVSQGSPRHRRQLLGGDGQGERLQHGERGRAEHHRPAAGLHLQQASRGHVREISHR